LTNKSIRGTIGYNQKGDKQMDKTEKFSMFIKGLWNGAMFWIPVRPTSSKSPYVYETNADALKMLCTCYPDQRYGVDVKVDFTSKGIHK
jgi:hypothetical protein